MINHALCLLMNVDGTEAQDFTVPAAELIDPSFAALDLPTAIDNIRAIVFGVDPDKSMLFYRCRQILATIHSTVLESYVTALDPRITYRFVDTDLVGDARFRPVVSRIDGDPAYPLVVFGDPAAPDITGRMRNSFLVETLTATTVQVHRQTSPMQNPVLSYAVGDTLPLAGAGYTFRLSDSGIGQRWLIEVLNRPQRNISDIADLLSRVGEPTLDAVLGITQAQPYLTFRNLWFSSVETPLRFAALMLAMIYRSEEVRVA